MMSDIDDMPKKQNDECSNESSSHKNNSTAAGGGPQQEEGSTKDALSSPSSSSSSPPPRRLLEEQHAISVLQLLLDRGYFHEKDNADTMESTTKEEAAEGHASVEGKEYNPSEATLLETTTSGGTVFCTLNHLHAQLKQILEQRKCCTLAKATQLLGLKDDEQIHRIIHHPQQNDDNDDDENSWILLVGDQIITDAHLKDVALWLQQALMEKGNHQQQEKSGAASSSSSLLWISMADVAREWKWTGGVEDVVRLLLVSSCNNKYLGPLHIMHLTRDNGTRVFMLQVHYANLQKQFQETLQSATRPMSITKLCQENKHWEKSWIDSFIKSSSNSNNKDNDWVAKLDGDWHNGGETYIPHVYTRTQQEAVVDTLLHQSGLVLVQELCATLHIRPNQVQSYINQAMIDTQNNQGKDNDIIFLQECIVNLNILVPPIEALVQDAVTNKTWCELDLPIQLFSSKETMADAKILLNRHVVLKMNKDNDDNNNNITESEAGGCDGGGGVVAVTMEGAMFASRYFVLDLETNHVRPLIPRLAQAQAKRDWAKRQQKTSTATNAMTPTTTTATTAHSLLSMDILTETVTRACPDLARFAEENASLVQELCKCAFWDDNNNNAELSKLCQQAVQDEFVRWEKHAAALAKSRTNTSTNNSEGGVGGGGGTIVAHHTTAEVSFEDASCFAAACYLLQAMAKFIDYAESRLKKDDDDDDNNVTMELLRQAFFQGACADFTRRMTQFCLHKFNMDDDDSDNDDEMDGRENAAAIPHFKFEPKTNDITSDGAAATTKQPSFCSPIDIAMRRYPYKTYLSCNMVNSNDDGHDGNAAAADDSKREPLAVLRTVLPRNVGQALVRQWTLCGKACYKTSTASGDYDDIDSLEEDDAVGGEASRDSSVVAFLSHVEEHCLTICGIPFKKLDKKSEKSFLAARKQRLVQSLQTATDPKDVLEWTVMILYQSVKNQTVFDHHHIYGNNMEQHQSLLCGPILQLLLKERKISPAVAKVLTDLADGILNAKDGNVDVDNALVERVRACGLCKDIAKHVVVVEE